MRMCERRSPARVVHVASKGRIHAYALGIAALFGAFLIALSQLSAHPSTAAKAQSTDGVVAVAGTAELLAGIPQRGNVLGSPTAPVRLVEYADLQCPYCALYARDVGSQAQVHGVRGVPALFVGPRDGTLEPVPLRALAVPEFRAALDGALRA
jgi:hypothetical protein